MLDYRLPRGSIGGVVAVIACLASPTALAFCDATCVPALATYGPAAKYYPPGSMAGAFIITDKTDASLGGMAGRVSPAYNKNSNAPVTAFTGNFIDLDSEVQMGKGHYYEKVSCSQANTVTGACTCPQADAGREIYMVGDAINSFTVDGTPWNRATITCIYGN